MVAVESDKIPEVAQAIADIDSDEAARAAYNKWLEKLASGG